MRKGKNTTLLIGIALVVATVLWRVIRAFCSYSNISDTSSFYATSEIVPASILLISMVLPIVLLVQNLKNKSNKGLVIASLAMNSVLLLGSLVMLISLFIAMIPEFLIYSKINLFDTMVPTLGCYILHSGIPFLLLGYLLLTVGSLLSLVKREK